LHLAKKLLLSKKINPNIWYVAMVGTAIERTDMTGFALARPLDAMPDRYLPAFVFGEDFDDRHKGKGYSHRAGMNFKNNTLKHRKTFVSKAASNTKLQMRDSKNAHTNTSTVISDLRNVSLKLATTRVSKSKKVQSAGKSTNATASHARLTREINNKLIMIREGNGKKDSKSRMEKSAGDFRAKGDDGEGGGYGFGKIKQKLKEFGEGQGDKKKGKGKKGKGKDKVRVCIV
jgi:hypothetical protein